jgi:hypothetical protein
VDSGVDIVRGASALSHICTGRVSSRGSADIVQYIKSRDSPD